MGKVRARYTFPLALCIFLKEGFREKGMAPSLTPELRPKSSSPLPRVTGGQCEAGNSLLSGFPILK